MALVDAPIDVLLTVFGFLPADAKLRAEAAGKAVQEIVGDPVSWRDVSFETPPTTTPPAELLAKLARGLPHMERADFSGCAQLTPRFVADLLAACPRLESLSLKSCCGVNDAACFAGALRRVDLRGCALQQEALLALPALLPLLVDVNLAGNQAVDDEVLGALAGLPLESVDVSSCPEVKSAGLAALVSSCAGSLRLLRVENVRHMHPRMLEPLEVDALPRLRELHVSHCRALGDDGLQWFADRSPALRALSASKAACGDGALQALGQHCPRLEELDVSYSSNATDSGVQALARGCARLRRLVLSVCFQVGDASVAALAQHCPALELLLLGGCSEVTEASLVPAVASWPLLHTVSLSTCGVSEAWCAAASEACPLLHTVSVKGSPHDLGAAALAALAGPGRLRELRLGSCWKVGDAELLALLRASPRLHTLQLVAMDGVTDAFLSSFAAEEGEWGRSLRELKVGGCRALTQHSKQVALAPRFSRLAVKLVLPRGR